MIVNDDLSNDPGLPDDVPTMSASKGGLELMQDYLKGETIIQIEQSKESNPDQTTTMCFAFLMTSGKGFEVRVSGVIASAGVALLSHDMPDDSDSRI